MGDLQKLLTISYCNGVGDHYIPPKADHVEMLGVIIENLRKFIMFITPAYAQSVGGGAGSILELVFPLVAVAAIMWFLVIRPQRASAKKRDEMLNNLRRNDTVITGGGIVGKVTKVIDEAEVEIQIAPDTKVRVMRSLIADVRIKGEPVKTAEPAKKKSVKADKTKKK